MLASSNYSPVYITADIILHIYNYCNYQTLKNCLGVNKYFNKIFNDIKFSLTSSTYQGYIAFGSTHLVVSDLIIIQAVQTNNPSILIQLLVKGLPISNYIVKTFRNLSGNIALQVLKSQIQLWDIVK